MTTDRLQRLLDLHRRLAAAEAAALLFWMHNGSAARYTRVLSYRLRGQKVEVAIRALLKAPARIK